MISRVRDKPRPVPSPIGLVVKPAAKIRFRTSGGIPEPVSAMEISTESPSSRGAHGDRPIPSNSLGGVHDQVQKGLVHQARITLDFGQVSEVRDHRHPAAKHAAAQFQGVQKVSWRSLFGDRSH